jgi:choline dehydrogenase
MDAEFLVIGAGAAGCVIAARLVAAGRRVILAEAGPDRPWDALPEDLADGRKNSYRAHDWGLKHRPTPQQVQFPFPRGRVVGGSSAVNTCIGLRGTPEDYDGWAAMGLTGWGFEYCLPAFRAIERDVDFADAPWHGADGPLPLRRHPRAELDRWQAAFLDGCAALGLPACDDHNRPGALGWGPHPMNKDGERRVSAATAWLTPDVRSRLDLRPDHHALSLLWDGGRVVGATFRHDVDTVNIRADRVVLALGAVHTPMLLWRSGVGPAAALRALGGEVRVDAAVGETLRDHVGAAMFLRPRYKLERRQGVIQVAYRYTSAGSEHPGDMMVQPGSFLMMPSPVARFGGAHGVVSGPVISLMSTVQRPRSAPGRLQIRSLDPMAAPEIDSRLLDDPGDRRRLAEGIQLDLALARTAPMSDVAAPLLPWAKVIDDVDRLQRWLPWFCDSGYHPCGTVPMGGPCDGAGRVRGVEGLSVGDASLFPEIPSANIHLPTLMVAHRIADALLGAPGAPG